MFHGSLRGELHLHAGITVLIHVGRHLQNIGNALDKPH